MITLDELLRRSDDAVRHASPYWLTTARHVLREVAGQRVLTDRELARLRVIETEMRDRGMPT